MNVRPLLSSTLLLLLAAACGDGGTLPAPTGGTGGDAVGGTGGGGSGGTGGFGGQPVDRAPQIEIVSPAAGATVPATSLLVVRATDDVGVGSVVLELDGGAPVEILPLAERGSAAVEVRRELELSDGAHALVIRVQDTAGQQNWRAVEFEADRESPPVILEFEADASAVEEGASAELRWHVLGEELDVYVDGIGDAEPVGSAEVTIWSARSFWLRARNAFGESLAHVSITTTPGELTLEPAQATAAPGDLLYFQLRNALRPGAQVAWSEGVARVDGGGMWTAPEAAGTYEITVEVEADPPRIASASIEVAPRGTLAAPLVHAGGAVAASGPSLDASAAVRPDGRIWVLLASASLLRFDPSAGTWNSEVEAPFAPGAIAVASDGTVWASAAGAGTVADRLARLAPGATAWELVEAEGSGGLLALGPDDRLHRYRPSGGVVERLGAEGWEALGPGAAPQGDRILVGQDGTVYLTHAGAGTPGVQRLPPGGAVWESAGCPITAVKHAAIAPDGRLLVADDAGIALLENGAWTQPATGLPGGSIVVGLGFAGDAAAVAARHDGARTVRLLDGTGEPRALPPLPGSPFALARVHGLADGTTVALSATGVVALPPGGDAWEPVGAKGLPAVQELVVASDGTLAARAADGLWTLTTEGAWTELLHEEAGLTGLLGAGAGGFAILGPDGTIRTVATDGTTAELATIDPSIAASQTQLVREPGGNVLLVHAERAVRRVDSASNVTSIEWGESIHGLAPLESGRIIGCGKNSIGRLEPGSESFSFGHYLDLVAPGGVTIGRCTAAGEALWFTFGERLGRVAPRSALAQAATPRILQGISGIAGDPASGRALVLASGTLEILGPDGTWSTAARVPGSYPTGPIVANGRVWISTFDAGIWSMAIEP